MFGVAPDKRIAVFNILGDTEFIVAAAAQLAAKLGDLSPHVTVTGEAKSIPLAFELALVVEKPWVVLSKTYKPYMGEVLALPAHSRGCAGGRAVVLFVPTVIATADGVGAGRALPLS